MAIYHCSVKIIGRSTGRSSVGAAAYRAGEKIKNERDGVIHDYTKKLDVEHSEIVLPRNAPAQYLQRAELWNAVEKAEKRKDSQTAREIEVALPAEMSRGEQISIVQSYIISNFTSRGMCADFSIHAGHKSQHSENPDNPHAHIMLTTRTVTPEGFQGKNTDWNKKPLLMEWRENWAQTVNRAFELKGMSQRIDHRTLTAQGIDREATIHLGKAAHQMEKRGRRSERGTFNEGVRVRNMAYERDFDELQHMVNEMNRKLEEQQPQHVQAVVQLQVAVPPIGAAEPHSYEGEQTSSRSVMAQLNELNTEEKEQKRANTVGSDDDSAINIAERLCQLRSQYIDIDMREAAELAQISKSNAERQKLEYQATGIQSFIQEIGRITQQLAIAQHERQQAKIFDFAGKKRMEENIQRLEAAKKQVTNALHTNYGINPEQAGTRIYQLRQQASVLSNKRSVRASLKNDGVEEKGKKAIEIEYKTQLAVAMLHPQWQQIENLYNEKTAGKSEKKVSLNEVITTAKTESKLRNISIEDYRVIISKVSPDMAQMIVDYVKSGTVKTHDTPSRDSGRER